ncbi:hypothetical protein [Rhizobium sp. WYJ-E13]|uniref:DUF7674 family protein n=1 Tax=unclassified Rhizobium TaxID=2613769 RepID=UPI001C1E97C5|nr:hypothetical protein [Rhizobium sp. WYJ-E13]QWW70152.1 hypothetical protein KQ933_10840 [Rhizobium sp. WYJ-E13]
MNQFEFDRSNMFEPLLLADPSFRGKWEAFLATFLPDGDELPLYLALNDLARHLIEHLEAGDTKRLDAVFDVVERWHISGDDYVKEAVTIGLLEDLQNEHFYNVAQPEDFIPWLRSETSKWWIKVQEFWTEGKLIG